MAMLGHRSTTSAARSRPRVAPSTTREIAVSSSSLNTSGSSNSH